MYGAESARRCFAIGRLGRREASDATDSAVSVGETVIERDGIGEGDFETCLDGDVSKMGENRLASSKGSGDGVGEGITALARKLGYLDGNGENG